MNARELKRLMKQHDWSVDDLANILSRSTKTVQRWLEGEYEVPEIAAKLLDQHIAKGTTPEANVLKDQRVIKDESMTHSTNPLLNRYVSGIAANGDNGIDGLWVVGLNTATKELYVIYKSDIEQCPENRRPEIEFSEDDLLDKIKAHPEVTHPRGAGKVVSFIICESEVALMQMEGRDFQHGIADIFVWINYKGDMSEKLRRNAVRYNGKASSCYKDDEGLDHVPVEDN